MVFFLPVSRRLYYYAAFLPGFYRVFIMFSLISFDSTVYGLASMTFYRVLPGFHYIILDFFAVAPYGDWFFTDFYWVLLGFMALSLISFRSYRISIVFFTGF